MWVRFFLFYETSPPPNCPPSLDFKPGILFLFHGPFFGSSKNNLPALTDIILGKYIFRDCGWTPMALTSDPWPHRFFPTEIIFFLLGIFSYRIYTKIQSFKVPKINYILLLFLILGPILFWDTCMRIYSTNAIWDPTLCFCLYSVVLFIGLPVIFIFTRNNPFDRWIGEFSYPIYILHFAVLYFVNHILRVSSHDVTFGWQVALSCFIISSVMLYLLIYPMEKIRSHRILSHKM